VSLKLIIPHSVKKKDLGKTISKTQTKILKKAFFKPASPLAGKRLNLPKNTRLVKVYGTSPEGAIRIVFLFLLKNGNKVLLFHLPKKDKRIGKNITPKNKALVEELEKRLIQAKKNYPKKEYDIIPMDIS